MYFELLYSRLIDHMRARVRSGETTERRLARLAGISQPHMHNVLKGVRELSAGRADQVVVNLHLTVLDLLEENEVGREGARAAPQYTDIPLLAESLGPGRPFPDLEAHSGRFSFPALAFEGTVEPVAVRLAPDPQAPTLFQTGDIVVLDALRSADEPLDPDNYYAVDREGRGCLRQVERRGDLLFLGGGGSAGRACISLAGVNILEVVRARAIWIGRHLVRRPIAERPSKTAGGEYRRPAPEG